MRSDLIVIALFIYPSSNLPSSEVVRGAEETSAKEKGGAGRPYLHVQRSIVDDQKDSMYTLLLKAKSHVQERPAPREGS